MNDQKILIIEDERQIVRFLELELRHEGYQVTAAYDGIEGLKYVKEYHPDLVILDLMLPGLNGLEVCKRIRHSSKIPILMLTARDDTEDKVLGLDMGATDYITKPFIREELLARIRAAFRRLASDTGGQDMIFVGNLVIDLASRTILKDTQIIVLTKHEFDLLVYLAVNKGIVLTRDQILTNVWGYDYEGGDNIVDVYIRYLRYKIGDVSDERLIHTLRGVGYMLKEYENGK